MSHGNAPVFPINPFDTGINIRTLIAAICAGGLLADPEDHPCDVGKSCSETVARIAVQQADDLIAELNK